MIAALKSRIAAGGGAEQEQLDKEQEQLQKLVPEERVARLVVSVLVSILASPQPF